MTRARRKTRQRIVLAGLILLFVAIEVMTIMLSNSRTQQRGQSMTLAPEIHVNLTSLPHATPLVGEAAAQIQELHALVNDCPDYSPERRSQMEQHLTWLLDPSDMPQDVIIAMGTNPTGRLIFGMAVYTSTQWRLDGRSADSCLLPIGQALNAMLLAVGETPLAIFADSSSP